MTTATQSPIVKLAPNVPITLHVKYADVVEGQYGMQIRLKGQTEPGDPATVYVPVDCAAALVAAGATEGKNAKGEFYTIPRGAEWWTILKEQGAGEKYGHVTLTPRGATAPQPAKGVATPAPAPPVNESSPAATTDARIVTTYDASLRHVYNICKALNEQPDPAFVFTGTDVKEMTAALFIARTKAIGF